MHASQLTRQLPPPARAHLFGLDPHYSQGVRFWPCAFHCQQHCGATHGPAAVAHAEAAPAAGTTVLPTKAAASRVLFIGGLPAKNPADELEQQLIEVCTAAGCTPTRAQVMGFDSEAQRKRFAHGWLHKGFGLVAFQSESSVHTAAAAICSQVPDWGPAATMGPARQVPQDWLAHLTYTAEELSTMQQQEAVLQERRAHNRRQRRRQSQRLVESVGQLLASLQQPFGQAAQQLYQPLLAQQACQQLQQLASQQQEQGTAQVPAAHAARLPYRLQESLRWHVLQQLVGLHPQHQKQQQLGPQQVAGPIELAAAVPVAQVESQLLFDWSQIPPLLDPAFGGRLADADVVRAGKGRMNLRALRKRVQVESFALLLWQLTQHTQQAQTPFSSNSSGNFPDSKGDPTALHVVEFGSGSGNLTLPLAHLFPHFHFTAIDMKPSAVKLLQQRVDQAALTNVTAIMGRIEEYTGPADVVLALHACGSATDWALLQAAARGAAFIVSPCCIGKINKHSSSSGGSSSSRSGSGNDTDDPQQQQGDRVRFPDANKGLQYPRSQQLQQQMAGLALQVQQELQHQAQTGALAVYNKLQEAVTNNSDSVQEQCRGLFSLLAATADYSHQEDHSHPELAGLAKTNVEWDRGMCMRESGYDVALVRLLQPELTAKNDLLVGVHRAGCQAGSANLFGWQLLKLIPC